MARPSPIDDPITREFVITKLASGVSQALIARALGVHENTVGAWKKKKSFLRDLALKTIEIATDPLEQMRKTNPLAFLERHPEFRDDFAPPRQKQHVEGELTINFRGFDRGNKSPL
jgi:hypothetical protein